MSDTIDFQRYKNERDIDPEFIMTDDFGQRLYLHALSYEFDGSTWGGVTVWAYSMEDAQKRVDAMRESIMLLGQLSAIIPA